MVVLVEDLDGHPTARDSDGLGQTNPGPGVDAHVSIPRVDPFVNRATDIPDHGPEPGQQEAHRLVAEEVRDPAQVERDRRRTHVHEHH